MVHLLGLWSCLALPGLVFCQLAVHGTVVDAVSGRPLPYVNIGVQDAARGTVSDEVGRFSLETGSADRLVFSALGYTSKALAVSEILVADTVALRPAAYALPTVDVRASSLAGEVSLFGVRNDTRGHSIAFGSPQLGAEIGSPIRLGGPVWLESAHFVLNHAKGDSLLFRVNIYRFEDGEVGQQLLPEDIYILEKQRPGIFSVDLTSYELVLEGDIFLSLEWLRNFDELGNRGITFDTGRGKQPKGVYARWWSNGPFARLDHLGGKNVCFFLEGKRLR